MPRRMSDAKYVGEITVQDPDSKLPVELTIYKDELSGGMFGVDSSWIDQCDESVLPSLFNEGYYVTLIGD